MKITGASDRSMHEHEHEHAHEEGRISWRLRLYVAGQSPRSLQAFTDLTTLCEEHLAGRYEIEVVDLVEHPEQAQSDEILAIPTLVRRTPPPQRKVFGDLSDARRVLLGLRIDPAMA